MCTSRNTLIIEERTIIQAHLLLPVTHFHIFADIYFHSSRKIDNAKVLLKSCAIDLGQQRKYRIYFTSFGWINISLDIQALTFIQIAKNELNILGENSILNIWFCS